MLDFDFEIKRRDACEGDRDHLFAVRFTRAVAVCFTRICELGVRPRVHLLLDYEGSVVLGIMVVIVIGEF